MIDIVSKEKRSQIMSKIKSRGTKLEEIFRKELWRRGYRYRKNVKNLPGKPDIYFAKEKIVVFIDSCFWHGCRLHCRMPSSNIEYWIKKIERNKERDRRITKYYKNNGFIIMRFWEHDINKNLGAAIKKLESKIKSRTINHNI